MPDTLWNPDEYLKPEHQGLERRRLEEEKIKNMDDEFERIMEFKSRCKQMKADNPEMSDDEVKQAVNDMMLEERLGGV